jgi:hypothetical protein
MLIRKRKWKGDKMKKIGNGKKFVTKSIIYIYIYIYKEKRVENNRNKDNIQG